MIGLVATLVLAAAPTGVTVTPRETRNGATVVVLTFADAGGAHRVTFTEHAITKRATKEDTLWSQRFTVTHEVMATPKARWSTVWEAKDFVNDCAFDLTLALFDASISVTDLDGDGQAEISFAYRLSCKSDVSPDAMKLLMYEGAAKYALRGSTRVKVGTDEHGKDELMGGELTADPSFDKAPAPFLEHAKAQWARFAPR